MKTFTIFLDFDGVLNNDSTRNLIRNYVDGDHVGFDTVNCQVLNNYIEKLFTECQRNESGCVLKIVICSTWRNFYTIEEMKKLLRTYLEDRWIELAVDTTELDPEFKREFTRAEEVRRYISKNDLTNYVILDDECSYDEFPDMGNYWIKTNAATGLVEEDIAKWKENNT